MDISEAQRHLENLYGVPGEDNETNRSMAFIEALLRELGVAALTEEAVIRLAEIQVEYETAPRY